MPFLAARLGHLSKLEVSMVVGDLVVEANAHEHRTRLLLLAAFLLVIPLLAGLLVPVFLLGDRPALLGPLLLFAFLTAPFFILMCLVHMKQLHRQLGWFTQELAGVEPSEGPKASKPDALLFGSER